MAFDSRGTQRLRKSMWVFCEQREGKLMSTDFELISEGRKLAEDDLATELAAFLATTWRAWRRSWAATVRTRCMCASTRSWRPIPPTRMRRSCGPGGRKKLESSSSAPPISAATWAPAVRPGSTPD